MLIEIPFSYDVRFIPKGRRSEQTALRVSKSAFDIREIPDGGAKRAFEVGHDVETKYFANRFPLIEGRPAVVWDVDGSYYAQSVRVDDFAQAVSTKRSDRTNPLMSLGHYDVLPFPDGVEAATARDTDEAKVIAQHKALRAWSDDGGAGKAGALQAALQNFVVVDGWVCTKVSEPTIVVAELPGSYFEPERPDDVVYIYVAESLQGQGFPSDPADDMGSHGRRFTIDRLDEARAYAERLAQATNGRVQDRARIDAVHARELVFADNLEFVGRAAHSIKFALDWALPTLPVETAMSLYRLRDELLATGGEASDRIADELAIIASGLGTAEILDPANQVWAKRLLESAQRTRGHSYDKPVFEADKLSSLRFLAEEAVRAWGARRLNTSADWAAEAIDVACVTGKDLRVSEILTATQLLALAEHLHLDGDALLAGRELNGSHLLHVQRGREHALATIIRGFGQFELQGDILGAYGRPASMAMVEPIDRFLQRANASLDLEAVLAF